MDFDLNRLAREIAAYEAEARRFEDLGQAEAAKAVRELQSSLERKVKLIERGLYA